MTTSTAELSDSSGPDEQQRQSEPEVQNHSSASGNLQAGVPTPPAMYMMPPGQLEEGHNMVPAAYPYMDPYYGSIVAAYGGQPVMHPHMMGLVHPGVPLPTDAVEEPVYVNAKQYHGILRRRQSRAKAESENKLIKSRKPYLHESRHLHALKRARGCSGRFLNSKSKEDGNHQQQQQGDKAQSPQISSTTTTANHRTEKEERDTNTNATESNKSEISASSVS